MNAETSSNSSKSENKVNSDSVGKKLKNLVANLIKKD